MNKTLKRIVLISLFGLFIIIGGITIFYAQGYRFDTATLSIQKVGAIFIKTIPGEAQVTLDGEPVDKSYWLFNSGKLIQGLFPKNYEIVVSQPNYLTAKLTILVLPTLVSELSHVLLIPDKNEIIASDAHQAESALSKDFPLVKTANQILYFSGSKIGKYEPVAVSNDGTKILVSNKANLYFVKKDRDGLVNISTSTLTLYPKDATYLFNENEEQILSYTANKIYIIQERAKPALIYSASSTIETLTVNSRRIAWLEKRNLEQMIIVYNKTNNKIDVFPIAEEVKISKLKWQANDRLLIEDENGDTYSYSPGSSGLNKIGSQTLFTKDSPDSKKIATVGKDRLEIFMENGKYLRTEITSLGLPEKIVWHQDSGHLIYKAGGKIYLIDIDTPIVENFQLIGTADNFWYDSSEDSIYLLHSANLEKIKLSN